MSKGELYDYVETLLLDVSTSASAYRKSPGQFYANSVRDAAFALSVVSNELASRDFASGV